MNYIEIYCDECRQDLLINKNIINENNRYIILGGIWIDKNIREDFKTKVNALRKKYQVYGEFKWKKVSKHKLDFYKEIINLFFETKHIAFRAIVVDSTEFELSKYHNSSSELGFYKLYYQLLKNWISKGLTYNIFLDYRKDKNKKRAYDLKNCLNNNIKFKSIQNIQFINSKESILLQLEDVIMGCIGYKYNYGSSGKSQAKNELIKEIEKFDKICESNSTKKKFNIFKINLKGSDTQDE